MSSKSEEENKESPPPTPPQKESAPEIALKPKPIQIPNYAYCLGSHPRSKENLKPDDASSDEKD